MRAWTAEEVETVGRLARSRTASARAVQRARIVWLARAGRGESAIAEALGCSRGTVRTWLRRFAGDGPAGLDDAPRSGRPPTYTPEQAGAVVAAALTDPRELGLPFASWALDRLAAYLAEGQGIPIKRSRSGELLQAEGLRWRTQETRFGERVDPAFAEKRGPSPGSTRPRLRVVR